MAEALVSRVGAEIWLETRDGVRITGTLRDVHHAVIGPLGRDPLKQPPHPAIPLAQLWVDAAIYLHVDALVAVGTIDTPPPERADPIASTD